MNRWQPMKKQRLLWTKVRLFCRAYVCNGWQTKKKIQIKNDEQKKGKERTMQERDREQRTCIEFKLGINKVIHWILKMFTHLCSPSNALKYTASLDTTTIQIAIDRKFCIGCWFRLDLLSFTLHLPWYAFCHKYFVTRFWNWAVNRNRENIMWYDKIWAFSHRIQL